MVQKAYHEFTKNLLYELVKGHGEDNVVVSPYSITNLLGMSAESTAGITRDEIVRAVIPNGRYSEITDLVSELKSLFLGKEGVRTANAALIKEEIGKSIREGYSDDLYKKFGGELLVSKDLVQSANKWVNEKTGGMIPQIMDESMNDVLACLINAIMFEAKWKVEYEEWDIKRNMIFLNADKTLSHVTMLSSTEDDYVENKYFTGFTKPYKNGFSYMALLPIKKSQYFLLKAIENTDFCELYSSRTKKVVDVVMPEFTCEFEDTLNQLCMDMGIETLFTNEADFAGMSNEKIKMDSIIHKAKIEVNRQGTRAVAVTEGVCIAACAPDQDRFKYVRLDRPFIYAIVHNETGLPLFIGTVNQLPDE